MAKNFDRHVLYTTFEEKFMDFIDDTDHNPLVRTYRERYARYGKSRLVHAQNKEKYYLLIMLMHGDFSVPDDDEDEDEDFGYSSAFTDALAHLCPDYYINPRVPLLNFSAYRDWLKERKCLRDRQEA